jgi:hypothetical protein
MSNSTDVMRSRIPADFVEMEPLQLPHDPHRLTDWAMDAEIAPDDPAVPDVMDFLADLAVRRQALLQVLRREA